MQVLELLKEGGDESFDTMLLLQTLGQVKTDVVDGRLLEKNRKISSNINGDTEMKGMCFCWLLLLFDLHINSQIKTGIVSLKMPVLPKKERSLEVLIICVKKKKNRAHKAFKRAAHSSEVFPKMLICENRKCITLACWFGFMLAYMLSIMPCSIQIKVGYPLCMLFCFKSHTFSQILYLTLKWKDNLSGFF